MAPPPAVVIRRPRTSPAPVIASIPHSGIYVPPAVLSRFTAEHRRGLRNTDWFLDALYDFLPALGVTSVIASHSRYVADVNRDPGGPLFGRFTQAVVARTTNDGRPVYAVDPPESDLAQRIPRYHAPYHDALRGEIGRVRQEFGRAFLLDLHSFMGPTTADACLGDRHGQTCRAGLVETFRAALASIGLDVALNRPFAGGYVVKAHAAPPDVQALQIELRYTNYMDCSRIDEPEIPAPDPQRLGRFRAKLRDAFTAALAAAVRD